MKQYNLGQELSSSYPGMYVVYTLVKNFPQFYNKKTNNFHLVTLVYTKNIFHSKDLFVDFAVIVSFSFFL